MTTNHHTAISAGAAANASTFNTPLGALDAQITTNAAAITANALLAAATTAEVVAARGSSPDLDARLDALVLAGGNVATKANGVSAAGQKVLTVDSTTGFIVGAYVTYLLNGTTLEGNTIGSIQAGVSLTLGTNIGTGGVLDDSYISMISTSEYLAAQAIPHAGTLMLPQTIEYANAHIHHVEARGGSPAKSGAENYAAIAAAIAAASAGDIVCMSTVGEWSVDTQIVINKPLTFRLAGASITGPTSGYVLSLTVSDITVEGQAGSTIKMSTGSAGAIKSIGMRTNLRDLYIDPNNVQSAKVIYQLGGWYNHFENISIDKGTTHSTTVGLYIESDPLGEAGPNGTWGGSYFNLYENVLASSVSIIGDVTQGVTTTQFISLDSEHVVINYATGIAFLMPVMQPSSGIMFDIANSQGITTLNGDFEGGGTTTVYKIVGSRSVHSKNNSLQSFTGTYLDAASDTYSHCSFEDDQVDAALGYSPLLSGYGAAWHFQGSNLTAPGTTKHTVGVPVYNVDRVGLYNNAIGAADDAVYLFDESKGASAILLTPTGPVLMQFTLGAGARTQAGTLSLRSNYLSNVLTLGTNSLSWNNTAPANGTWARGDVVFNVGADTNQPIGWQCIAAGTPGTWKALPVIPA